MRSRPAPYPEWADVEEERRLLGSGPFRRLLESRVAGQTASNAMVYALLIWLVQEEGSSIHATLLVIALTLPAALLGVPAGAIADILPRRLTMTLTLLARAGVAGALVYYGGDLGTIYLLVLAHASIGLLFGPAEAAAVPAVVTRQQLPAANALMTLGLMVGQIAGMVVLAPVLIKLFNPDAVFAVSAALFGIAAVIVAFRARGFSIPPAERAPSVGFAEAVREGFRILRTDRHAYLAIVYLVTAVALSKVLVILLPEYTRTVLDIEPENAVFVAAPAAIGAGLGLLLVPLLARFLGAWRVVALGFLIFLAGLLALGMVVYVRDFLLENLDFGIGFVEEEVGVSSVITVTMLLAIPLGFSFTLLGVASRVVMNEQAPPAAQGRVFSVQMALGDVLSLVPLLVVGVAADVFGVRTTLLTATAVAILLAGFLTFSRWLGPGPETEPELPVPAI
jgi:MFS family permease